MSQRCVICGKETLGLPHQCPPSAVEKAEREYRREERKSESCEEEEPGFDERLEDGFKLIGER